MPKAKKPTTNGVIDLYWKQGKRPRLTIQKLDKNTILIEGNAKALEFLGEFVLAHSRADADDCGTGMDPKGEGSAWFTKESTFGFYLHRLPCRLGKRKRFAKKRVLKMKPKQKRGAPPAKGVGKSTSGK